MELVKNDIEIYKALLENHLLMGSSKLINYQHVISGQPAINTSDIDQKVIDSFISLRGFNKATFRVLAQNDVFGTIENDFNVQSKMQTVGRFPFFGEYLPCGILLIESPTIKVTAPAVSFDYISEERCKVITFEEVKSFARVNNLIDALEDYTGIACRIFSNAKEIKILLTSDPEIKESIKIRLNIKIKSDVGALLKLDKEFYKAIDFAIPDKQKDFFVKTYEILDEGN